MKTVEKPSTHSSSIDAARKAKLLEFVEIIICLGFVGLWWGWAATLVEHIVVMAGFFGVLALYKWFRMRK